MISKEGLPKNISARFSISNGINPSWMVRYLRHRVAFIMSLYKRLIPLGLFKILKAGHFKIFKLAHSQIEFLSTFMISSLHQYSQDLRQSKQSTMPHPSWQGLSKKMSSSFAVAWGR